MATRLDEISQAIGALQSGQHSADSARLDHATRTERQFSEVDAKLDKLDARLNDFLNTIDSKVESSISKYTHGTVGGIVALVAQWAATHFGFKVP